MFDKIFDPKSIAQIIQRGNPARTPIKDLIYGESQTHPFAEISTQDIYETIKCLPMISAGASPSTLGGSTHNIQKFKPEMLAATKFYSADDIRQITSLTKEGIQQFLNNFIERIVKPSLALSNESMCAQAVTGKFAYKTRLADNTFDTYTFDFLNNGTFTDTTSGIKGLWDQASTTFADIDDDLEVMYEELRTAGFDPGQSNCAVLTDSLTWKACKAKLDSKTDLAVMKGTFAVENGRSVIITPSGFKMYNLPGTYKDAETQANANAVESKHIQLIDLTAGHTHKYCSITNLKAGSNFAALPFLIVPEELPNGTGINIHVFSTPFPLFNAYATKRSQVIS